MRTRAALAREIGKLTVEEVELDPPKAHEVLVRMQAAGVCHSDLHTYRGEQGCLSRVAGLPFFLPAHALEFYPN